MKRVLITGTTSGLGNALVREYNRRGWQTIAINRRNYPDSLAHINYVCDVRDRKGIAHILEQEKDQPIDLYLLNAGINKVDTVDGILNKATYTEVMEVNFMGFQIICEEVILKLMQAKNERHCVMFCGFSSTTNFFPNPSCAGYAKSKQLIHEGCQLQNRVLSGKQLHFRSLVLGPIATNISTTTLTGWQGWVRKAITVSPEKAAKRIADFLEGNRQTLYYPLPVCALFWIAGKVNKLIPFYTGSR